MIVDYERGAANSIIIESKYSSERYVELFFGNVKDNVILLNINQIEATAIFSDLIAAMAKYNSKMSF